MGDRTGIEWTDATWNPVRGCARVSAGCQHCYAERVAARFAGEGGPYEGLIHQKTGAWNGTVKLVPEALQIPWRWSRPRRIFVNSMSDLFHPDVPFEFIAAVFWVMSVTSRHTYQILTKRPERMLEFFHWLIARQGSEDLDFIVAVDGSLKGTPFVSDSAESAMDDSIHEAAQTIPEIRALWWEPYKAGKRGGYDNCGPGWPYENVWLGVSVENQKAAEERIPLLLQCPAAVRWISAEPLLGPVDLRAVSVPYVGTEGPLETSYRINALTGEKFAPPRWPDLQAGARIDWVVAGGESGPGARPMHPAWARSLLYQCTEAGVPFLFKQWGDWAPTEVVAGGDLGGDMRRDLVRIVKASRLHAWPASDGDSDGHFRPGDARMRRLGKKAAGRLLDGALLDEYPEAAHG
ncbi:MAG: phage Gp37/Gp68 family protein [Lysobacter sp.]|nr:phage Gp37/Gp68 family protein [Lysobacter sp.]